MSSMYNLRKALAPLYSIPTSTTSHSKFRYGSYTYNTYIVHTNLDLPNLHKTQLATRIQSHRSVRSYVRRSFVKMKYTRLNIASGTSEHNTKVDLDMISSGQIFLGQFNFLLLLKEFLAYFESNTILLEASQS
jgi:hypothetical protein